MLIALIFLLLVNGVATSQTLTISNSGNRGKRGVNWNTRGKNPVYIETSGDAVIHPSVIEECLNKNINVTISSQGNIFIDALIQRSSLNDHGKITFLSKNSGSIEILDQGGVYAHTGLLDVFFKTSHTIIVHKKARIVSGGGVIRLQSFAAGTRERAGARSRVDVFGELNSSATSKGGGL